MYIPKTLIWNNFLNRQIGKYITVSDLYNTEFIKQQ